MKGKEQKLRLEKWKCAVCYNLMEYYTQPEECKECGAGKHKLKLLFKKIRIHDFDT